MIIEEIRAIRSERADLRKFGITMCIGLGALAALFLWRDRSFYKYVGLLSPIFLILGLVAPDVLRPVHRGWMSLAVVMGWVMTRVILTLLFYIGVTPVGIIGRLFGKQFLDMGMDDSRESYWIRKEPGSEDRGRYEKQY